MMIGAVNIDSLLRAFKKFESFLPNQNNDQEKAGVIQSYEYCFELVWKTMKRLLEEKGLVANSPRETFRMAALEGLIDDPEVWFDFLKKRNLTVHTYNESDTAIVLEACPRFAGEVRIFLSRIGAINHGY